jgi:hypothetical protein
LGYGKEVTGLIISCWGRGLSAEETKVYLKEVKNVNIGIATIYRHRKSLLASHLIDELIRAQLRDILETNDLTLRLKYRDKLLAKLVPHRIHQLTQSNVDITEKKIIVKAWQPKIDGNRKSLLPTESTTK